LHHARLLPNPPSLQVLPSEIGRKGGTLEWLEQSERIIFARQGLSHAADNVIVALLGRLKTVAAVLDSGEGDSRKARRRAMEALSAIGASAGYPSADVKPKRRKQP
jgi:hypothetical protein